MSVKRKVLSMHKWRKPGCTNIFVSILFHISYFIFTPSYLALFHFCACSSLRSVTMQEWIILNIIPKSKANQHWTYLPNTIAVRAVVPEDRADSREHVFANAASVSINDLVTTFSSSKGKSASSTITLGKWSRTNCAAHFPSCPSNTCYSNQ